MPFFAACYASTGSSSLTSCWFEEVLCIYFDIHVAWYMLFDSVHVVVSVVPRTCYIEPVIRLWYASGRTCESGSFWSDGW